MKHCPKCNTDKTESEFSKDATTKDGLRCHCKPCSYVYSSKNKTQYRKSYSQQSDSVKASTLASVAASRARYPEKEAARVAVHRAIQGNRIKRQPCVVCGETKSHGHHEDYSKPLEVLWLCRPHHVTRHAEIKQGVSLNNSQLRLSA